MPNCKDIKPILDTLMISTDRRGDMPVHRIIKMSWFSSRPEAMEGIETTLEGFSVPNQ